MSESSDIKKTKAEPKPKTHDAPGLSPFERMRELARAIVNVPKVEADRAKKRRRH